MSDVKLSTLDHIRVHRYRAENMAKDLLRIARNTKARESEGALILTQAIAYASLAAERLREIEDRGLLG